MCIYIYIYREREIHVYICVCTYIYIYIYSVLFNRGVFWVQSQESSNKFNTAICVGSLGC